MNNDEYITSHLVDSDSSQYIYIYMILNDNEIVILQSSNDCKVIAKSGGGIAIMTEKESCPSPPSQWWLAQIDDHFPG